MFLKQLHPELCKDTGRRHFSAAVARAEQEPCCTLCAVFYCCLGFKSHLLACFDTHKWELGKPPLSCDTSTCWRQLFWLMQRSYGCLFSAVFFLCSLCIQLLGLTKHWPTLGFCRGCGKLPGVLPQTQGEGVLATGQRTGLTKETE